MKQKFFSLFAFGCTIFLLLIFSGKTYGQKYSNEFLSIGVSSRAMALSNSILVSSDDVFSGLYNPTGLLNLSSDFQIGLTHIELFSGLAKHDFIGGSRKLNDHSAIGISMVRFAVDDIPNTIDLIDSDGNIDYDNIRSFSVGDYGFFFSYARKSKIENLRYGMNVKIIRRKAGDFASAWGFGLDLAALYDYKKWHFGAMGKDLTSTFNAWSFTTTERMEEVFILTGNEIPTNSLELTIPRLLIGASRVFDINEKFRIMAELDADLTFDRKRNVLIPSNFASIDPHLGVEVSYKQLIFVRGGIGNAQKYVNEDKKESYIFQPSMGVGLKVGKLGIDYAFTSHPVFNFSHIISVKYSIDQK